MIEITLPPRDADSHKGDFGRALLIGGSRGMSGAIALAGMAALRGGAGLVQLAVPAECQRVVAAFEPSYMTAELPSDDAGRIDDPSGETMQPLAQPATAVACGPGLGRSASLDRLTESLFTAVDKPLVLDADALNALSDNGRFTSGELPPPAARILTPHPGEFARLLHSSIGHVQSNRQPLAEEFARRHNVVLLLKGRGTVVTDGTRTAINATGNPGMATGGSGDVLTGIVTALLCQGLPAWEAARLGAHLHGRAGDLAAARIGQVSLTARDIVDCLPQAIQELHPSYKHEAPASE